MKLTRRSFIKTMAATLAISHVPALATVVPIQVEPQWMVEEFDFGREIGVAAQWIRGEDCIRNAYIFNALELDEKQKQLMIAYCKQALRQWYMEKHLKIRSAA